MATYTKTILLINKVFSWDNVLLLLNAISKSAESIPDAVYCISVTCEDNFNVKYNSFQEFRDSNINAYNILRLCSVLRSSKLDIELHLHADSPNLAEIRVSGSEEQIVNAIIEKIKEISQNIKSQEFICLTQNLGIRAEGIFALVAFVVFFVIRYYFIEKYIDPILMCIVGTMIGILSVKFANWICKVYPTVEFEFIPYWKNSVKKRRAKMKFWIGGVFLPLGVSIGWDIIKLLLSQ